MNSAAGPGDDPVSADSAVRPRRTISPRLADILISVGLVLASLVLALVQVPQHATVSPIDEYVYIDYLDKVPTQLVVRHGEETGEYARHYLSCHGVRTLGFYPESFCTDWQPADVERMPNEGKNAADIYTPVYFVATWVMAQPVQWLGVDDLTAAGRYTGWVWLGAAAVLLYLTLRRWKVAPLVAGGVGLLMVGSLPAYWSNTYISTDATALLAGSLMLFGLTMFARPGRRAPWLFILFGVLVTAAKLQNLTAVAVAGTVLLILAFGDARGGERGSRVRAFVQDRRTVAAVAAVVASVAVQVVWVFVRRLITVGSSPDQGVSSPVSKSALLMEVFKFFPGVSDGAIAPDILGFPAPVIAAAMRWVVVAGVLGLLAVSRRGSMNEALALATFAVSLVAAPLLAVATIAVEGYYFALPLRYGMPLLPFMLACAALLFARSVWTRWFVGIVAIASYGLTLTFVG